MNVQLREAEHYTQTERNKLARSWYTKARYDFQTFRYIMRPKMLRAWWQEDVAYHLMQGVEIGTILVLSHRTTPSP